MKKRKNDSTETNKVVEKEFKSKKPVYKKWWFWVIIVIILIIIIGAAGSGDEETSEGADAAQEESTASSADTTQEEETDSPTDEAQEETDDASSDGDDGVSPADYDDALSFLEAYIDGVEENTSSMVDAIAEAAKKQANYSGASVTEEALEYISSNYPEYFTSNQVMEYSMYYGYYLEYAYADNGSDNTYANLGMDTYQAVKYVYRGTETTDDDHVQANLEQIAEALNELGYSVDTAEESLGTTAEYDNCILEITGAYTETDEEGEPVLKITATYTNNNEDPLYAYSAFAVKAFQNGIEITDVSINQEDHNLTTEVKDGASIDVVYTFLLSDDSVSAEFYACTPTADEEELAELVYEP